VGFEAAMARARDRRLHPREIGKCDKLATRQAFARIPGHGTTRSLDRLVQPPLLEVPVPRLPARGSGDPFLKRLYLEEPPTVEELETLLELLGASDPDPILRRKESLWKELELEGAPRARILEAVAENPRLLERPILVAGGRALVARPPERWRELAN